MLPKNENKINLIEDKHDNFTVYKSDNCHTFISIYIDEIHEENFGSIPKSVYRFIYE